MLGQTRVAAGRGSRCDGQALREPHPRPSQLLLTSTPPTLAGPALREQVPWVCPTPLSSEQSWLLSTSRTLTSAFCSDDLENSILCPYPLTAFLSPPLDTSAPEPHHIPPLLPLPLRTLMVSHSCPYAIPKPHLGPFLRPCKAYGTLGSGTPSVSKGHEEQTRATWITGLPDSASSAHS